MVPNTFNATHKVLFNAIEKKKQDMLRFLDLNMNVQEDHVFRVHTPPRSQKALMPNVSAHLKPVKKAIISVCFSVALHKLYHMR